jgi:hypothetical protein
LKSNTNPDGSDTPFSTVAVGLFIIACFLGLPNFLEILTSLTLLVGVLVKFASLRS